jgi:hypothetical protein
VTLPGFNFNEFAGNLEALGLGERAMAARWASGPKPLRPCLWVDTRM